VEDKAVAATPAPAEDWTCVVCDDRQFARNSHCRRCGMMKPTPEAVRITEERKLRQAERWRDWTCLYCDQQRFACNTKCFKCRTPKPTIEAENQHKEAKLAKAQAVADAKQRAVNEVAANERRLTAAVWDQARLLLIGARDDASPLSRLPSELVAAIARWATARPECWASSRLAWFKATARASPQGTARVRITTSECNIDTPGPWWASGYVLEYHLRAPPSRAVDERFTVHSWQEHENTNTSGVVEHWTEARFLTKATYEQQWHYHLTYAGEFKHLDK
jgi:hypothetical protein